MWDKNNDASLGVVLTPHDIVELMVDLLDLNKNDKILDFCTGTGSFLIECGKINNNLYGCENNEERYSLAKCNFILHDLNYTNLKYNSCFNENYETNYFDKIIINPPFSCKCQDELNKHNKFKWKLFDEEQKFIIYMIELLKINGLGCCIIPRSNFNNSIKSTNDFKKEILKYCKILKIYNCNSKVFIPNASVECTILLFQKINNYNEEKEIDNSNVEIIDYSDDGYKIKKKLRYYDHKPNLNNKQYKQLEYNNDWNYRKEILFNINDLKKMIEEYNNNYQYALNKYNINNKKYNEVKELKYKKIKFLDILEPIKYKTYTYDKCEDGNIPFYVASQMNIPKGYKNVISIDCEKLKLDKVLCINKSGEGVIGYCHIRTGKFACNSLVGVFKMKINLDIPNIVLIQEQIKAKYNHHFENLNNTILNELELYLLDENFNYEFNYNLTNYINPDIIIKEWKLLKIGDYFELVNPKKTFTLNNSINGEYPLITRTSENNGISKFINDYSFDGDYITIAPSGSTGSCFYHNGKFAVDGPIKTFKPKKNNNISLHIWAMLINYYLPQKYSYNNGLTIDKILNEEINMPIY